MIQEKVFKLMDAAKERIIKTMQERGITSVSLVMPWEEWANENGFDATDEPDSDYEDYCREEAPCVIFLANSATSLTLPCLVWSWSVVATSRASK